ncbi:aspartate aminotransferase family protein [Roseiterribacter gracilis]|uniref:Acetylornithine aminotransferase n=1 Tax=Roseiterribacter gracilis TaxID=2812848 RepID=A0A8S8XBZ5_9PROT|nr:acetylornithine aminotransferase [Rhodospirillales bacterium TMPK1]
MFPPVMPVYARADVRFERGEGVWLWDDQGRRYLDFVAGIGVTAFGHAHPRLVASLTEQAKKLWHVSNLYTVPGQERLGKKLVDNSFADTVFFTNSGVEAWECGVKTVRKHFHAKGQPQKNRIIVIQGAFHGRTLGAISAAKSEKMVTGFGPLLDGFDQVAFGNLNEMRAAITAETAAINLEPVIGEGGIKPWSVELLQQVRKICDEFGLLLFLDEIQCGLGRTGKLWAYEYADIKPDVMCVAKAIGNGFPLGACLATADAASGMVAGVHGSTYGGNPLAMAVGETAIDMLVEPGFLGHVQKIGAALDRAAQALVERHPTVFVEQRGIGLMRGIKCAPSIVAADFVKALLADGLCTVGGGENVVRLLPPLIIEDEHIKHAMEIFDRVATKFAAKSAA